MFIGDEAYIIREFERFVKDIDPDIITGWNIDNFDIPQLIKRADKNQIEWPMLARNQHHLRQHSRFWKATGRVIADGWWHTKLIKHPKKETLNAVAQQLLGKKKLEIQAKNIDHHWATEKEKVIKYCLNDARLALEILLNVQAIEKGFNMGTISKLPLSIVLENKTSQLIDSLLIREAERENFAVPCTTMTDDDDEDTSIKGGYVHEIKPGVRKWLVVLDFKSMYPSIIIANNLCFSTYSKDGTIITPIGAHFLDPSVKLGILPRIMRNLQMKRDQIKKLMRAYPENKEFYDGLQNAVKILSNAHYGVFTSDFYRFTNKDIGASITAYARKLITSIIEQLIEEGHEVAYGDTDSIMVQSPYNNLEETVQFGKDLSKRFTFSGYTLEFEKVFESFFSHGAKKRYVGKMVWPEQDIFVRGYETRRTDAFDLQSDTLSEVFNLILDEKPREAMNYARGIISEIKKGNVEMTKLAISKTCKDFSVYKKPQSMSSVQCAQKLMAMGYPFNPGSKVTWIVTDGHVSPAMVEPYLDGVPFKFTPDWEYYAERMATTIGRATEAFGWGADFLSAGKEQDTLDSTSEIPIAVKSKEKSKTTTTIYQTKPLDMFDGK
jgi:DNA polymerase I